MKETNKNEIDLLLRKLAKSGGAESFGEAQVSQHLDADELNAYAEDALPSAARSRYTKHLIECSSCRGMVTRLALSTGRGLADAPTQLQHRTLRDVLRSLFSAGVIRYAGPVLATLLVLVIGIVVLRLQQRESDYTAKRQAPESLTATPQQGDSASNELENQQEELRATSPPQQTKTLQQEENSQRAADKNEQSSLADTAPTGSTVTIPKEQPESGADVAQPTFAPDPKPAAVTPPPPAPTSEGQGVRSQTVEEGQAAARDRDDFRKRDGVVTGAEQNRPAKRSERQLPLAGRMARAPAKNETAEKEKKQTYSSGEVRVVAGRQFRREGSDWVDTDYTEGRAAVLVRRGSEQYRALVADEPAIKQIAEELNGTVIALWKGRVYKLQ